MDVRPPRTATAHLDLGQLARRARQDQPRLLVLQRPGLQVIGAGAADLTPAAVYT